MKLEERQEIEKLMSHGISLTEISKLLKRSQSTISQEVRDNGGKEHYNAILAHKAAQDRKANGKAKLSYIVNSTTAMLTDQVRDLLIKKHSTFDIIRITGVSFFVIRRIANKYKLPVPSLFGLLSDLNDRLIKLEETINKQGQNNGINQN